jgi:pilus assembly protein CpaE
MLTQNGILLMTSEPETHRAVVSAINGDKRVAISGTCSSTPELVAHLRRHGAGPATVIVDLDPDPQRTLALLDPIISRFADARFIALAHAPCQSLLLDAMHAGTRVVIPKEAIAADLSRALKRLTQAAGASAATGCVLAVVAASGGCGATVLAANLADELRDLSGEPSLLVDMDEYCGAVSAYLGLEAQYGLATVLADGDRIDGELIKSAAAMHESGLHVLLSPAASATRYGAMARYEHMPLLMAAARNTFGYTVIDAPRLSPDILSKVVAESTAVIVPFQLTVMGIRAAKNLIRAMLEGGCAPDHIIPLVNRYRRRRVMIDINEAARALGRQQLGRMSNDFKAAVESINLGRPLAGVRPRSKLRRDIRRMAEEIHKAHTAGLPMPMIW